MKRLLFVLSVFLLLSIQQGLAARVDTVLTTSASMKKNIKAVVILPDGYREDKLYPTVYLLHGAGDIYSGWVNKVPAIKKYADDFQMIIVCPDGNVTSWYFDSPEDPAWKYETYVATELVAFIDQKYKTIKDRKGRAITGLSMGGHGALYLAFRHQDVFGAAGSMSGGVDIKPFPLNWDIAKRLGPLDKYPERWKAASVVDLTHLLIPNKLALIIDCGKDDFFYNVNIKLHEQLQYSNIPHDFTIRPGAHNWDYWKNAIGFQLMFMNNFFTKK
ncbi:alpha/beta hydrolase [Pedobacter metabolipauper]|uniref:S-formylglutathione hydrolase FrmB n=1 Tax=Pedobacter metabolipauper TaxID=425513 RepID=A0A4R6SU84_9SPHI|nr:alpha/beta hydrolase family protein [Pedobacter metabolipauper]TDQ07347.1 S-formylglutathione hydrolase FrmB [Pedobacter metabolipauper]